ncbi:MAG: response regulator transcription factor [Ruminococcaceae bacterium]|nr:response regulator transcription factor [Oscillospiraceae bacterium]
MRILIVEDERHLADAISEIIKGEKYQLDTVYDGEDGYNYAVSGIYDCIILDIMLPKIDGIEVLKRLRREKIDTPVLLLTAKNTIRDKVIGLDSGADDYMTKPFSSDELLARIRTLTRRRGEIIPNEICFADTVLVTDESELKSALTGKSIRLSFKEAEIMKLFLSSPKKIISKSELILKVWGYDSDATDNNVEAYISFLRKKLTFIGALSQITSIKKLGYRIEEIQCLTGSNENL